MTKEEAKAFLTNISYDIGTVGIEDLTVKDGQKMRDAIETLLQEPTTKNDLGVDCISKAAPEYATSSIKTDETYQLMYEGVEVFDKDTVAWMFRELQLEIEKMSDTVVEPSAITITSWKGMQKRICDLVQFKIDKLRENIDGQERKQEIDTDSSNWVESKNGD